MTALDKLAKKHGINPTRPGIERAKVPISDQTKRKILSALHVETNPAPKSFLPSSVLKERVWGITAQLYELRSSRNWGIGDFEDLARLCEIAASWGADFVGLSPLHAPFLADPDRCSPYEPSNRRFLNPLYIAVDRVKGFKGTPGLDTILEKLRRTDLVDYSGVAKAKLQALRQVWKTRNRWSKEVLCAFRNFEQKGGAALRLHALFEALSSEMQQRGKGAGWTAWPLAYQNPDGEDVQRFESDHREEVEFHIWLQWLAHQQLSEAAARAEQARLRIGLYLDLAVGEALDGSATWSERDIYVWGASIGSPPDPWAINGQDWKLAALQPSTIAAGANSLFRKIIDETMRYAGALRIDHAAALRRLYLVPFDSTPEDGAYVEYPDAQLLRVLAEASHAHCCAVIGEDLGLVPRGLRDQLSAANILSYRILSYEKRNRGFAAPARYPRLALACVSTHDHQTMVGWWNGADIDMRLEHRLVPTDAAKEERQERERERARITRAFNAAGIALPPYKHSRREQEFMQALVVSAYRYVGQTPCVLVAARLADMTNEQRPTNVPGTSTSYPNWRPKLSIALEDIPREPLALMVAQTLATERPRKG
ncbi:4-alpha-glucanotransferase [Sinorhizobium meliloti]|uniref:4-alpha-glucanotransferase n=1 Tax=Rhizobium meliloti TaxID=382 RepID=UPI003F13F7F1